MHILIFLEFFKHIILVLKCSENVKQLPLFMIDYPFVEEIFNCKGRNCMLVQKYLYCSNV